MTAKIGDLSLTFALPSAFCRADPSNRIDASWIAAQQRLLPRKQRLLVLAANCSQLNARRDDRRGPINDVITVTVPSALANRELPLSRGQLVTQMGVVFRNQGVQRLSSPVNITNRRIAQLARALRANDTTTIGILHQDANGIYLGLLLKRPAERGDSALVARVVATTLVRKRMISVTVSASPATQMAIGRALATARAVVDRTIAANEK